MAKKGIKETPQLRGNAKIYCPEHGRFTIPMLPPLSCPGCEMERGHGDMLRRPIREERRWKRKQREHLGTLEENE